MRVLPTPNYGSNPQAGLIGGPPAANNSLPLHSDIRCRAFDGFLLSAHRPPPGSSTIHQCPMSVIQESATMIRRKLQTNNHYMTYIHYVQKLKILAFAGLMATASAGEFPFTVVEKNASIAAGEYEMPKLPVWVKTAGSESNVKPILTLQKGVIIKGGELKAGVSCKIVASESDCNHMSFWLDNLAVLDFTSSHFDQCIFSKVPGNYLNKYSTFFKFKNCYISNGLIENWDMTFHSIYAEECTVTDWAFPTYKLKGDSFTEVKDGLESKKLGFIKCHFVRSRLPVSMLWFCTQCTYENCEFYDDSDGYESSKRFTVDLGLIGKNDTTALVDSKKTKFSMTPAKSAKGCLLPENLKKKIVGSHQEEARDWTDIQGRKIKGTLVAAEKDDVEITINGKQMKIPKIRLSDEDKKYVEEWAAKKVPVSK